MISYVNNLYYYSSWTGYGGRFWVIRAELIRQICLFLLRYWIYNNVQFSCNQLALTSKCSKNVTPNQVRAFTGQSSKEDGIYTILEKAIRKTIKEKISNKLNKSLQSLSEEMIVFTEELLANEVCNKSYTINK